jgi:DNA-directed RNA polymerase subunit M/transcription elongation factor TFIIS
MAGKLYRVSLIRYVAEETEILVRADSPEAIEAAAQGSESQVITHADNTASWDGETTDLESPVCAELDASSIPHLDKLPVLDLTKVDRRPILPEQDKCPQCGAGGSFLMATGDGSPVCVVRCEDCGHEWRERDAEYSPENDPT